jgi:phosphopantothenoylcysteine decarboxylase / phosphopantothenate---cysteine ligase
VADFRPSTSAGEKIKKDAAPGSIELERTPDILAGLGERKGKRVLVGFAAETGDVVEYARGKLTAKNLDMVVANDVSEPGVGFDSPMNRVVFVTAEGEEALPVLDKHLVARELVDRLAKMARGRTR